jgi:hypothetical protein
MIHQELSRIFTYEPDLAHLLESYGVLFGGSASLDTFDIDTFTITGNVQPIAKMPKFELNGFPFMRVLPMSEWAPDHDVCIALMPPRPLSTGKTILDWFGLTRKIHRPLLLIVHAPLAATKSHVKTKPCMFIIIAIVSAQLVLATPLSDLILIYDSNWRVLDARHCQSSQ